MWSVTRHTNGANSIVGMIVFISYQHYGRVECSHLRLFLTATLFCVKA